jgi:tetratricopeptide (TPR) repeat protein
MNKKNPSQAVTSFWQKIALMFLGLILSLMLLEGGMQLGGFVLVSVQKYGNLQSIKQKGSYRILCLGESTTDRQYPKHLERILNQRNIGIHFSVIDGGRPGTNTNTILSRVESYLADYHPDIVVTMMGINDGHGSHMPPGMIATSGEAPFIRSLRTYKLAQLLWLHIMTKAKEMGLYKPAEDRHTSEKTQTPLPPHRTRLRETSPRPTLAQDASGKAVGPNPYDDNANVKSGSPPPNQGEFAQADASFKKAIELDPKNDKAYYELGRFYTEKGELSKPENLLKKAIAMNPKNHEAYVELGRFYQRLGTFSKAEDFFKKAIEINPQNESAYVELGQLSQAQGEFSKAEDSFKKAIETNPRNYDAYVGLGYISQYQDRFLLAEKFFRKAIELDPKNDAAYIGLGQFLPLAGKFSESENLFKKAIELDPKNDRTYFELGRFYRNRGSFQQAEDSLRKAVELNPENDFAFIELGELYRRKDQSAQAEELFAKAISNNPDNDRALGAMLLLYEETGRSELAKAYSERAKRLRSENYAAFTVSNYRKLKKILDGKGIKLVCAQYPVRNVEPLKRIFGKEEGIIFVDNERVFKEALRKGSYKEYFRDMFAGDFGHCTVKGNTLLAQNIADVILREVFNK